MKRPRPKTGGHVMTYRMGGKFITVICSCGWIYRLLRTGKNMRAESNAIQTQVDAHARQSLQQGL